MVIVIYILIFVLIVKVNKLITKVNVSLNDINEKLREINFNIKPMAFTVSRLPDTIRNTPVKLNDSIAENIVAGLNKNSEAISHNTKYIISKLETVNTDVNNTFIHINNRLETLELAIMKLKTAPKNNKKVNRPSDKVKANTEPKTASIDENKNKD